MTDSKNNLTNRVEIAYALIPADASVKLVGGLIMFGVLYSTLPQQFYLWFAVLLFVTAFHFFSYRLYRKEIIRHLKHQRMLFWGGFLASGATWGTSAMFLGDVGTSQQMSILMMIVGISAGGISSAVLSPTGFAVYSALLLSPLFFWLLLHGEQAVQVVLPTILLFVLMLQVIANKYAKQFTHTFALQIEKSRIADTLERSNKLLEAEIDVRRVIEDELRTAKATAENASESKSRFLSHLSHEIRTPLNAILGFTELLHSEKNLTEGQQTQVACISRAGQHLMGLINDVLDLAVIDEGKMPMDIVLVRLNEVIEESASMVSALAKEKNIHLNIDYQGMQEITLRTDPRRLKQILLNLMSNAIKYNKKDGWVELCAESIGDDYFSLIIRDSGVGINQEKLEELFTPFSRLGQEGSNIEGTGIGMTIAKRLVDMLDGEMSVFSQPGIGTEFKISFPRLVKESDEAMTPGKQEDAVDEVGTEARSHIRILIVEDNLTNQMIVRKQLSRLGYQVDCANDGVEALELLAQKEYRLIITDCNMPNMDGYELSRNIREQEDGSQTRRPIIAITADAYKETAQRCYDVGMDAYLTKPVDFATLRSVVAQWSSIENA